MQPGEVNLMSRTIGEFPLRLSQCLGSAIVISFALLLASCGGDRSSKGLAATSAASTTDTYLIGPGDALKIFVWQNADLSIVVPVRPDGRISMPLLQDLQAAQKTPSQLAGDIKKGLADYIQEPVVTVTVIQFVGPYSQQVRVIGEAAKPKAIPYRADMSVLDVMIESGGLTQFAAGNRAMLVRKQGGHEVNLPVNLDSLLKDGDLSANVPVAPGDVLIIPQSWF
ncbi:MAG: polysaccharide biosynthesis/export protein [Rhodospirillaceae bacterium]|jgi:polysaccharide export outer membrane protein|nr:polysaccharide biosynthesis/export protein [Rhodospirillaceae bacterium]